MLTIIIFPEPQKTIAWTWEHFYHALERTIQDFDQQNWWKLIIPWETIKGNSEIEYFFIYWSWPVIIPLSAEEYSTHRIGPAWQASTASHCPLETDQIRAVQSSLPVITVSPTILIDLFELQVSLIIIEAQHKRKKIITLNLIWPYPFCMSHKLVHLPPSTNIPNVCNPSYGNI